MTAADAPSSPDPAAGPRRLPLVAVVHTFKSPCLCHATALAALSGAGIPAREIDADSLPENRHALAGCAFAFDLTDTYRGGGDRFVVAGALQQAGIPVIGTPPPATRVADDKILARRALARLGLPVPPVGPDIGWPRVLKAPRWHGSRAVRIARNAAEEGKAWVELLGEFGPPLLVEEFVPGKEVSAALVGREQVHLLPLVEVQIPAGFYGFEDKWSDRNPGLARAELPEAVEADILRRLAAAYQALGLRDYARFDLRVRDDGRWAALEVNVRPSLEPGGVLEAAARLERMTLQDLVLGLLAAAGGPGERRR